VLEGWWGFGRRPECIGCGGVGLLHGGLEFDSDTM
jgi:hypothetical protein